MSTTQEFAKERKTKFQTIMNWTPVLITHTIPLYIKDQTKTGLKIAYPLRKRKSDKPLHLNLIVHPALIYKNRLRKDYAMARISKFKTKPSSLYREPVDVLNVELLPLRKRPRNRPLYLAFFLLNSMKTKDRIAYSECRGKSIFCFHDHTYTGYIAWQDLYVILTDDAHPVIITHTIIEMKERRIEYYEVGKTWKDRI